MTKLGSWLTSLANLVGAPAAPVHGQMKLRVNWSAIAAGQSGIWIAQEDFTDMRFVAEIDREGFFRKMRGNQLGSFRSAV